jgi:hypothetical protein
MGKTNKAQQLISILVKILQNINLENNKQAHDSYINVHLYAGSSGPLTEMLLVDNFDHVFGNDIFGPKTVSWSSQDLIGIYVYYSESFKKLMNSKDESQQPFYRKLSFRQYNALVENLLTLTFDNRLFPSYNIKALEELKHLLEVLRKEVEQNPTSQLVRELLGNDPSEKTAYHAFVSRLLHKMVIHLKITRDQVQELHTFLSTCDSYSTPEKEAKSNDDVLFREMPRFEECPDQATLDAKIMNFINKTEGMLNDNSTYYYHGNQKMKPSPLMEDKEGFVMNSLTINNKYKAHIQSFTEDNIYKRIALLNEISSMLFLELVSLGNEGRGLQGRPNYYSHEPHLQTRNYIYQVYADSELQLLRRMYKLNLEIFTVLTAETKHLKDNVELLRFNCAIFERVEKERDIRMDQRQLYMLLSENLPLILVILKNFVRHLDIYPHLFYMFFDSFSGTDILAQLGNYEGRQGNPQQNPQGQNNERFIGLYTFSLYSRLFIKHILVMFNKLPEKIDPFHPLYDKDINIHYFFLKILKFIFRTIKFREELNKGYTLELINLLKKHIFKLIMVTLKLSITNYYPMDYLSMLKIIFRSVNKSEHFLKYFTQEIKEKQIRMLDYFVQLYKSNIEELRIMSTELVLIMPFDLKYFITRNPEHAKDFISIITFALTLQPSVVILKSIQILDHIISSSTLFKDEVLLLLENNAGDLIKNLTNLVTYFKERSYFLKATTPIDKTILPASLKILARLAPFVRNLNIPIVFSVNDDYILELEKNQDKVTEQEPSEYEFKKMFEINIEETDGKKFIFNVMPTLTSIFQTLDILKTKPNNYSYCIISPNLLFISTVKHQIGLETLLEFLKKIFYVLAFTKNEDIENGFASLETTERTMDSSAMDSEPLEQPAIVPPHSKLLLSDWKVVFDAIQVKPMSEQYLLQRLIESSIFITNYLCCFVGDDVAVDRLSLYLKEVFYTLAAKAFEEDAPSYLQRNFLVMYEALHNCIRHQ